MLDRAPSLLKDASRQGVGCLRARLGNENWLSHDLAISDSIAFSKSSNYSLWNNPEIYEARLRAAFRGGVFVI